MASRKNNDKFSAGGKWPRKGKRPPSTAKERTDYAREQWEADPNIPINGNRGMVSRLMEVFGVTVRDAQLMQIRQEVLNSRKDGRSNGRTFSNPVIKPDELDKARKEIELKKTREEISSKAPPPPAPEAKILEMPKKPPTMPLVLAPGAGRSLHDARVRYDFARSYLQRHPNARQTEVIAAVTDEFGVGIGAGSIGTIKRELGVGITKRRTHEARKPPHTVARVARAATNDSEPASKEVTHVAVAPTSDPEEAIKAAIQLLIAEVPNLLKLHLDIDENGKPSVDFSLRVSTTRSGKVEL